MGPTGVDSRDGNDRRGPLGWIRRMARPSYLETPARRPCNQRTLHGYPRRSTYVDIHPTLVPTDLELAAMRVVRTVAMSGHDSISISVGLDGQESVKCECGQVFLVEDGDGFFTAQNHHNRPNVGDPRPPKERWLTPDEIKRPPWLTALLSRGGAEGGAVGISAPAPIPSRSRNDGEQAHRAINDEQATAERTHMRRMRTTVVRVPRTTRRRRVRRPARARIRSRPLRRASRKPARTQASPARARHRPRASGRAT